MKWAILLSLLFIVCAEAATKAEHVDMQKLLEAAWQDCYEDDAKTVKVEFTETSIESVVKNDPNPSRSTKCLRHCGLVHFKLSNDEGIINTTNVKTFLQTFIPNFSEAEVESAADITEKCFSEVTVKDRCDKAHEGISCVISTIADQGIEV